MLELLSNLDASSIGNVILSALTIFGGGFLLKFKSKFTKAVKLIKEVVDVADEVVEISESFEKALKDNRLDKKEIEELAVGVKRFSKELKEVKVAYLALVNKKQ